MPGFRPRLWALWLAAVVASITALAATTIVGTAPALCGVHAWVDAPPAAGAVTFVADKAVDKTKDRSTAYVWSAIRLESRLRLRGSVPSEDDRRTILGMVKAHFPDLSVEDRLKVVDGAPPKEQWLGAVSFGLKQLSHLKRGSVRLLNIGLKVGGEARSAADFAEVKKALSGPLPTGLTIASENIRPPVADPFVFVADLNLNALSLSGSVPSEGTRKELRDLSRQLFARPGLEDGLELASGAPKGWNEAVVAALRALSSLESGKIALSGLAVTIEGVAPDQGTAVAVSYQLRRDLPKLFSTSESISWKEASTSPDIAAQVVPRIKDMSQTIGEWPKGQLPPLLPLIGPAE